MLLSVFPTNSCLITNLSTLLFFVFVKYQNKRLSCLCRSGASLGQETSATLDYLLFESGYNRRVRPETGGEAVTVHVNLDIRSMGPVDEMNEVYSLDCYFRQSWMDKRLRCVRAVASK